jgi:predicted XRE-type DNA-binding protein
MTKRSHDEVGFTVGSGNVFRDLGIASPNEELSKARLARQIHDRAVALELYGTQLAARLAIPQPKASRLLRGFADGFSTEKLLVFLTRLGQDVRIVVSAARGRAELGKMTLTMPPPVAERSPRSRPRAVTGGRRTRSP